ncbi:MAG: hypothetical protein HYT80_00525 [Euryarchaeota archaeon]|nr:hypothetical protein [Euryarchaeota archaeon]
MPSDTTPTSTYDEVKTHEGQPYSGVPVYGTHQWRYPNGYWTEMKLAPDKWTFQYASKKIRTEMAPDHSGADVGSSFHWFITAHQTARKLDAQAYETFMTGLKWKIGHRRPYWRDWSHGYPEQQPEMPRIREILMRALHEVQPLPRSPGEPRLRAPEGEPIGVA